MAAPLLQVEHVSRVFSARQGLFGKADVRAVSDVSFSLFSGETLGLVGESGCGKSTLARMAVGLLSPTEGTIQLHGRPLTDPENAGRLQMIFQDPFSSLNPRLRVGTSIGEPLRAAGLSAEEQQSRVLAMLERVGLRPEHAQRYPHEFSGGQRQRIAIARALVARPELVVCDEAVSALDASVQAQVLNLLQDAQESFGLTYLFISHALSVVGHMSDRIAVMYLGRIVELAPRAELLETALHPYTRALLAAAPRREPGVRVRPALPGEMPSPFAPPAGCAFHPRCPYALPVCGQTLPELEERRAGQWVRCHRRDVFGDSGPSV